MSKDGVLEMSEADHIEWLRQNGVDFADLNAPTEENLIRLVSDTLRTLGAEDKAQSFIEIANMCIALADKTLGSQSLVPQCIVLQRH
jgi:hypothetical protein